MRRAVLVGAAVALMVQFVGVAASAAGPGHHGHRGPAAPPELAQMPQQDRARGVVTAALSVATDGPCAGLLQATGAPGDVCTHGPDPAPPSIGDVRTADLEQDEATELASTAPEFACDGDGTSGRRAHAIYAVAPDRTDRFATYEEAFKGVLASVQDEYRQSSLLHGAVDPLVYRFTHTTPVDGTCEPLLDHVELPSTTDDDSFTATIAALEELGYTDASRRYLVFVDAQVYCGIGQMYADDDPSPESNRNNTTEEPLFSRVDAGCWGYAESHELSHNIGAVQFTAPNTTGAGHCNDDHDLMCYDDEGPSSALQVVDGCDLLEYERRLDCRGDDYFNPQPLPGSYLDTHWNTADSGWLFTEVTLSDDGGTTDSTTDTTSSTDDTSDGGTTDDGTDTTEDPPPPATAPTVGLSAPSAGVVERTFTVRGSADDADGDLAAVRIAVDGKVVTSVKVAATGGSWSTTITVAPGDRKVSVRAVDELGATSKWKAVEVLALADMPTSDLFRDDDTSPFEAAIERLAVQGVTRGCNPPTNDRFCPDDGVTRGQMAAFLARALDLPSATGVDFVDDDRSAFEDAIERLAAAGITRGCNPPTNDRFCPDDVVTRGQMAAFLTRALYT